MVVGSLRWPSPGVPSSWEQLSPRPRPRHGVWVTQTPQIPPIKESFSIPICWVSQIHFIIITILTARVEAKWSGNNPIVSFSISRSEKETLYDPLHWRSKNLAGNCGCSDVRGLPQQKHLSLSEALLSLPRGLNEETYQYLCYITGKQSRGCFMCVCVCVFFVPCSFLEHAEILGPVSPNTAYL